MRPKKLVPVLLSWLLAGCGFAQYGRIPLPGSKDALKPGATLEEVVRRAGPPDKYAKLAASERLCYQARSGWWTEMFVFGFSFGQCYSREVELDFVGGALKEQRSVPVGSATGIYIFPGIVAE